MPIRQQPAWFFSCLTHVLTFLEPRCGVTKGSVMDRYISTIRSMRSVFSIPCFQRVAVGVVILGGLSLWHARALRWRWAPLGAKANSEAAYGFAMA